MTCGRRRIGLRRPSRVPARVAPADTCVPRSSRVEAVHVPGLRVRLLVSTSTVSCPLAYARERRHPNALHGTSASKRWDQAIRLHGGSVLVFHLVRAAAERPGPVAQWKSVPFTPGRSLVRSQPGPLRSAVTKAPPQGCLFSYLDEIVERAWRPVGWSPASACFLRTATAPSGPTTRVVWAQLWCLWPKCA